MAIYRTIQMSFWTDTKVTDDFTPEDKYFYLYLMTNPHTNLAGCYEISFTQMSIETGYTKDIIEKLIKRMEQVHQVIRYAKDTKEVLILNWSKYNWTSSPKFKQPLWSEIGEVKDKEFRAFLTDLYNGKDTVSIPYPYGSDTSVTVTVSDKHNVNLLEEVKPIHKSKSNTDININIYKLLDDTDMDVEVKEVIKTWVDYKKEQFKFEYKPIGFKALLTEIANHVNEIGKENTIRAVQVSMAKGYKGIIWDLVKNNKQPSGSSYIDAIHNRYDIADNWLMTRGEDDDKE